MQVLMVTSLVLVLWAFYGYSLAFTEAMPWLGSFAKVFLSGVTPESLADTFTDEVKLPEYVFIAFQGTFAAITCSLIVGAFAERIKFASVMVFTVLWFTFSYLPIAHMVWGPGGWLLEEGAIDFAGGTVVHINAGVAGLVGAMLVGKRLGYGREALAPHSLPLTMVGASLLWVGWFGFNAGSNLEATSGAAIAFLNTLFATAAAVLSWSATEALVKGKPSMLGAASGAVAGLVVITPACGTVGPIGAIVMGLVYLTPARRNGRCGFFHRPSSVGSVLWRGRHARPERRGGLPRLQSGRSAHRRLARERGRGARGSGRDRTR
jgi:Amt family ammonium transporter